MLLDWYISDKKYWKMSLLVTADRCARSSTSIATWTNPPSSCDMHGGTGASYSNKYLRGSSNFNRLHPQIIILSQILHSIDNKYLHFTSLDEHCKAEDDYLRVSFSSNWTKCAINNIHERGGFQIFFRAIAYKKATTCTVHTKLLFQFSFTTVQSRSQIVDIEQF